MKHYFINTAREFKNGGRSAVKMSTDDFFKELKKFNEKYADDYEREHLTDNIKKQMWTTIHIIRRMCCDKKDNWIKKDFKNIKFDWENFDYIGDVRATKGVPYYLCRANGDWETGIYFMVYYDGHKIRVYVPTVGNPYRLDIRQALGNDEAGDDEYVFNDLCKSGVLDKKKDIDKKSGIYNKVVADKDSMIKDFSARLDVKKTLSESY